jgi:ATP-dependent helicase/DNAse subunit B
MSEGHIEINPYELGRDTACDRCVYASVCGVRYKENHENRKLSKYQEKSLWKLINSERNGE